MPTTSDIDITTEIPQHKHIGDAGSEGYSTGPHLHFEIRPGGWGHAAVDAEPWLTEHGAEGLDGPGAGGSGCAHAR